MLQVIMRSIRNSPKSLNREKLSRGCETSVGLTNQNAAWEKVVESHSREQCPQYEDEVFKRPQKQKNQENELKSHFQIKENRNRVRLF